jgi:hypothetical protein
MWAWISPQSRAKNMSKHKYHLYLLFLAFGIETMSGQVARYTFDVIYETNRGVWAPNMAREGADKPETDALDLLMYDTNGKSKNMVRAPGAGGKGYALDLSCNLPGVENAAEAMHVLTARDKTKEQNSLTLTGWIKTSAPMKPGTALFGGCYGARDTPSGGFLLTADDVSNMHVRLFVYDKSVHSEINDERISKQGEWIFYAVSWNGETGVFQWHLGGETAKASLIAAQAVPESIGMKVAFRSLSIGGDAAHHAAYCGSFDDIRVYAEALTTEQIEDVRKSQFQDK